MPGEWYPNDLNDYWAELDDEERETLCRQAAKAVENDPVCRSIGQWYSLFIPMIIIGFITFEPLGIRDWFITFLDSSFHQPINWVLNRIWLIGSLGFAVTRLRQMRREIAICHSLSVPYLAILRIG